MQRVEMRQKDIKNQALAEALRRSEMTPTKMTASPATPNPSVRCNCGQIAERLTVKKEGPRKGRKFFKCMQRECEFFQCREDPTMSYGHCFQQTTLKRQRTCLAHTTMSFVSHGWGT